MKRCMILFSVIFEVPLIFRIFVWNFIVCSRFSVCYTTEVFKWANKTAIRVLLRASFSGYCSSKYKQRKSSRFTSTPNQTENKTLLTILYFTFLNQAVLVEYVKLKSIFQSWKQREITRNKIKRGKLFVRKIFLSSSNYIVNSK